MLFIGKPKGKSLMISNNQKKKNIYTNLSVKGQGTTSDLKRVRTDEQLKSCCRKAQCLQGISVTIFKGTSERTRCYGALRSSCGRVAPWSGVLRSLEVRKYSLLQLDSLRMQTIFETIFIHFHYGLCLSIAGSTIISRWATVRDNLFRSYYVIKFKFHNHITKNKRQKV